jgi:hypothetical protein
MRVEVNATTQVEWSCAVVHASEGKDQQDRTTAEQR